MRLFSANLLFALAIATPLWDDDMNYRPCVRYECLEEGWRDDKRAAGWSNAPSQPVTKADSDEGGIGRAKRRTATVVGEILQRSEPFPSSVIQEKSRGIHSLPSPHPFSLAVSTLVTSSTNATSRTLADRRGIHGLSTESLSFSAYVRHLRDSPSEISYSKELFPTTTYNPSSRKPLTLKSFATAIYSTRSTRILSPGFTPYYTVFSINVTNDPHNKRWEHWTEPTRTTTTSCTTQTWEEWTTTTATTSEQWEEITTEVPPPSTLSEHWEEFTSTTTPTTTWKEWTEPTTTCTTTPELPITTTPRTTWQEWSKSTTTTTTTMITTESSATTWHEWEVTTMTPTLTTTTTTSHDTWHEWTTANSVPSPTTTSHERTTPSPKPTPVCGMLTGAHPRGGIIVVQKFHIHLRDCYGACNKSPTCESYIFDTVLGGCTGYQVMVSELGGPEVEMGDPSGYSRVAYDLECGMPPLELEVHDQHPTGPMYGSPEYSVPAFEGDRGH